jgi:protein-L-isoaspartate(D-aspartate) O-methyltransferase
MLLNDIEQARRNMVLQQIRPWEVIDERVLRVIQDVPRENYVPDAYRGLAFADIEVPLGHGQAMMAPRVEARMLQALNVQRGERVLEIGTGSGYVTACLAGLGSTVTSLDIHADFTAAAQARLDAHGIKGVTLRNADAFAVDFGIDRFDAIAVTGSLPQCQNRFEQLLTVGGRLFLVCGQAPVMEAMLVTRVSDSAWRRDPLFETVLAPLENAPLPEPFEF